MLRDRQLDAVVFGLPSLALQESLEAASVERRKEMAESMPRAESAEGVWNARNAMPDQAHETPTPISCEICRYLSVCSLLMILRHDLSL